MIERPGVEPARGGAERPPASAGGGRRERVAAQPAARTGPIPVHRFRIPTLVMAATVAAGLLLAAITGIAVLVAMRESLGPRLDPATDLLVREMILSAAFAWLPFGALIGWFAGRRLADPVRVFAEIRQWKDGF